MKHSKRVRIQFLLYLFATLVIHGCKSEGNIDDFNGGFEIVSEINNEPSGWYPTRVPRTNAYTQFEVDSAISHSDKNSVSIAIASDHPQDTIHYNWTRVYEEFTVGEQYTISAWIQTDNVTYPPFVVVQCWNAESEMIGFATTQKDYPIKGTSDWTFAKTDFSVPEGTSEVRVRIGISAPDNLGGKVWFDDIKIE